MILAPAKILDAVAWMLGAFALSMGLLFLSFIGLGSFVWLYQGNSVLSLIWNFSQPSMLRGLADVPALALLLSLSAIALARWARWRAQRSMMAAWAVRAALWAIGCAGLSLFVLAFLFSCRLVIFPGM